MRVIIIPCTWASPMTWIVITVNWRCISGIKRAIEANRWNRVSGTIRKFVFITVNNICHCGWRYCQYAHDYRSWHLAWRKRVSGWSRVSRGRCLGYRYPRDVRDAGQPLILPKRVHITIFIELGVDFLVVDGEQVFGHQVQTINIWLTLSSWGVVQFYKTTW